MNRIDGFENAELCSKCSGKCCKTHAGRAIPEDFGSTRAESEAGLKHAFETKMWAIEPFLGTLAVRPAHVGNAKLYDEYYDLNCRCVFLRQNGCVLPFEKRPYTCRMLKPDEVSWHMSCHTSYEDSVFVREAWNEYQDFLKEVMSETSKN